jgi:hypothetical protein
MTIFKILVLISIIFMGNFLGRLERQSNHFFWSFIILLAMVFNLVDEESLSRNTYS